MGYFVLLHENACYNACMKYFFKGALCKFVATAAVMVELFKLPHSIRSSSFHSMSLLQGLCRVIRLLKSKCNNVRNVLKS